MAEPMLMPLPGACVCCGEVVTDDEDVMCPGDCEHPVFEMWAGCQEEENGD